MTGELPQWGDAISKLPFFESGLLDFFGRVVFQALPHPPPYSMYLKEN